MQQVFPVSLITMSTSRHGPWLDVSCAIVTTLLAITCVPSDITKLDDSSIDSNLIAEHVGQLVSSLFPIVPPSKPLYWRPYALHGIPGDIKQGVLQYHIWKNISTSKIAWNDTPKRGSNRDDNSLPPPSLQAYESTLLQQGVAAKPQADYYSHPKRRDSDCIKRCMKQGRLHPIQCLSLC